MTKRQKFTLPTEVYLIFLDIFSQIYLRAKLPIPASPSRDGQFREGSAVNDKNIAYPAEGLVHPDKQHLLFLLVAIGPRSSKAWQHACHVILI